MAKKLTEKQREVRDKKILEAISNHVKYAIISKKFGISKSTITDIKKKYDPVLKEKARLAKVERVMTGHQEAAITQHMIKSGELIVDNMVNTLKAIVYNVDKLYGVVEESRAEIKGMEENLQNVCDAVDSKIYFPMDENGKEPEREKLLNQIYKLLNQLGNLYPMFRIIIDGTDGIRKQVDTYTKLKIEEHAVRGIMEFFKAFFIGMNLLSDNEYTKLRDYMVENSSMARRSFKHWDNEIAALEDE